MNATRQAFLPETLEPATPQIATMVVGDSGYTTPWAMWVDSDRLCWLHPRYDLHQQPGGTVKMRVERRSDGWHVWPPRGETWRPTDHHGFHGDSDPEFVPVVELHQEAR